MVYILQFIYFCADNVLENGNFPKSDIQKPYTDTENIKPLSQHKLQHRCNANYQLIHAAIFSNIFS